jgi:hypothetical protein
MDVIFDLDGTVCDGQQYVELYLKNKPKRYDLFWQTLDLHGTHEVTLNVLINLYKSGCRIIFCTARSYDGEVQTRKWLEKHIPEIEYKLYMRGSTDNRKDYIIKSELLDQIYADGFNPVLAFDDKPEVVDMYRKRGLTCYHVKDYV